MTKTEKVDKVEETVNQPDNAPIAGQTKKAVSLETMSHQWQENSPAVNTNVTSEDALDGVHGSILDKIDTPENLKARQAAKQAGIDALEAASGYDTYDCSKLDVSDSRYCQPGSERHKAYLKATK